MNGNSSSLIGLIRSALLLVLMFYAWKWFIRTFFPGHAWAERALWNFTRNVTIEPVRQFYRAVRWLAIRLFTTNPDYRVGQIYLDHYPVTPLELFDAVAGVIADRNIIGVGVARVSRLEWHILSHRRIYLLVRFREAVCIIGAVPMGTGLLVTWRYAVWRGRAQMILFQIPYLGAMLEKLVAPGTFHRTDVYHAFEEAIRHCVVEATQNLTNEGVRPVTENERRPLLREFYNR